MSRAPKIKTLMRRVRRSARHRRFPFTDFLAEVEHDLSGLDRDVLHERVGPNLRALLAIVRHWHHTEQPPPWDAVARANGALRAAWSEVKSKYGDRPDVLISDRVLSDAEDIFRQKLGDDVALVWDSWYHHHPKIKQAIARAKRPVDSDNRKEPTWAS